MPLTIRLHISWPYITMNSGLLTTRCVMSATIISMLPAGTAAAAQLEASVLTTWTALCILDAPSWHALHSRLASTAALEHKPAASQASRVSCAARQLGSISHVFAGVPNTHASVVELRWLITSATLQLIRVRMGSAWGAVQLSCCTWHTPCPASGVALANTGELAVEFIWQLTACAHGFVCHGRQQKGRGAGSVPRATCLC
jgi:hypothetical protein